MNDQSRFEAITQAIGQKLWSIMPPEAQEIYFEAALYETQQEYGARWLNKDKNLGHFSSDNAPEAVEGEIKDLLREMQTLDLFSAEPWDHVTIILNEQGKIKFNYAYVPEVDHWPNLIMRGVSDLSELEINEMGFFRDDWERIVSAMIPIKLRDADRAEQRGNLLLANKLREQAASLKERLASYRAGLGVL